MKKLILLIMIVGTVSMAQETTLKFRSIDRNAIAVFNGTNRIAMLGDFGNRGTMIGFNEGTVITFRAGENRRQFVARREKRGTATVAYNKATRTVRVVGTNLLWFVQGNEIITSANGNRAVSLNVDGRLFNFGDGFNEEVFRSFKKTRYLATASGGVIEATPKTSRKVRFTNLTTGAVPFDKTAGGPAAHDSFTMTNAGRWIILGGFWRSLE